MKLDGPSRTRAATLPTAVRRPRAEQGSRADAGPARVAVSGLSKLLAQAKGPETPDAARVERLQQALGDGSFQVDPQQIAEVMLAEEV